MARIPLAAKTAVSARAECRQRWPKQDVNYFGYDKDGDCVIMSLVRGATKGNVATVHKNRAGKAVRFDAEPVGAVVPPEVPMLQRDPTDAEIKHVMNYLGFEEGVKDA